MSNGLVRPHITTGCAFATAGIMVCGFVAPSIEASGVRPEVRLVQLAALTGPVASPLGALVGTLPTTAEKLVAPVSQAPSGGPADVPASIQAAANPQTPVETQQMATAGAVGGTIWYSITDLFLSPLMWVFQVLPPPLQQLYYVFYLPVAIAVNIIGLVVGTAVDLVLGLFGVGVSSFGALAAVESDTAGSKESASDPIQDTADEVKGAAANFADPESGSGITVAPFAVESVNASTESETFLSDQIPAVGAEPREATEALGGVEVEPALAGEVEAAPTEPEAVVQEEVAVDPVEPADDVTEAVEAEPESAQSDSATEADATEAESATAQTDSTTEDRESNGHSVATSDNAVTAENSSPATSSKGSDSSGDTAGS